MSTRTYGGRTAEQIKAAAQAATPGPWETHPRGGMGYDVDPVESGLRGMVDRAEDAAHIAARIAALEAEAAPLRELWAAVEAIEQIKPDVRLWRNAGIVNWYTVPSTGSVASYYTLKGAMIALARQVGEGR